MATPKSPSIFIQIFYSQGVAYPFFLDYAIVMRDAIEFATQIAAAALLASVVTGAIGVVWFAIEATP